MLTLKKGILIAIEGIDGSGKSSLAKNLFNELQKKEYPVLLTKEPGGTQLGQQLRQLVQEKKMPICAKAEFMLFATDRAQHFHELIGLELSKKKIVISDRMADSSLVYQGDGRGLEKDMIQKINTWVMNNKKPDVTIFVNVAPTIAEQRIKARNIELTSFEREKKQFAARVAHGFQELYKNRNDVIIIDGNQSLDTVTHQAITALTTWITKNHLIQ